MIPFHNTTVYAPCFIFIKNFGKLSDDDLIKKFGFNDFQEDNYRLIEKPTREDDLTKFFVTEVNEWSHIMDDAFYTIDSFNLLQEKIPQLAKEFDIFYGVVGDYDDSYTFVYYKDGGLKRKLVVKDTMESAKFIAADEGTPLRGEKEALQQNDTLDKLLGVARAIGIDVEHKADKVRCYGRKADSGHDFFFHEDEL